MVLVLNLITDFFSYLQHLVLGFLLDAAVFYCIDKVFKVYIDQCRQLSEKCRIWMVESLLLFLISYLIYNNHHTPLLLWVFCIGTFLTSILSGQVDVNQIFTSLSTYWTEFKDQKEAVGDPVYPPVVQPVQYANQVSDEQNNEFFRKTETVIVSDQSAKDTPAALGADLQMLRYNEKTAEFEYVGPRPNKHHRIKNHQSSTKPTSTIKTVPAEQTTGPPTAANLRRRALHHNTIGDSLVTSVSPPSTQPPAHGFVYTGLESIGNKVRSVLSMVSPRKDEKLPPGLQNSGLNLCFLNTVLQCLARTPNLADELSEEVKSCRSEDPAQLMLIDSLSEILLKLDVTPSCDTSGQVVDSSSFIHACSKLNPDLVSKRRHEQSQQDASEFLNWLLFEAHEAVNDSKSPSVAKERLNTDPSMKLLKAVYGNISEAYITAMKQECREQIMAAKGMTDDSIVEPVQNLANMEWITHKRQNMSVLDECFTFQCVELQMCSRCTCTAVSVQNMSILALPMPANQVSTTVEECLRSLTAEEKLEGRDSLQCDKCQLPTAATPPTPVAALTPAAVMRTRSAQSSTDLTPLSPIADTSTTAARNVPRGEAGFLSSTPLPGSGKLSAPTLTASQKILTVGIRRSFLRRLPQCLVIQLLRFNYNPFTKTVFKVHTPMKVTVDDLELSSFTYDSAVEREDMTGITKQDRYSLYALCVHVQGDRTSCGHYLAYCKASDNNWYLLDDERVRLISDIGSEVRKPLVQENCYLMFYTKLQHQS